MSAHSPLGDLAGSSSAPLVGSLSPAEATRGIGGKVQSLSPPAPNAEDWATCLIPLTNNDASGLLFIFLGSFE